MRISAQNANDKRNELRVMQEPVKPPPEHHPQFGKTSEQTPRVSEFAPPEKDKIELIAE